MKEDRKKLICVVGPTASGKTGLGIKLAREFNGEIVSADSRQVYCGLDIGTGKEGRLDPNLELKIQNLKLDKNSKFKIQNLPSRNLDGIEQWLIDICEPEEQFTLFDWLELARNVLDDIWSRGKVPIVVGGTGLYVKALIEGFNIEKSECRNPKFEINSKFQISEFKREELEEKTKVELAEILKEVDKEAHSKIDLNNPYRMVRAIEKAQSGEVVTKNAPDFDYILIGLDFPREDLYQRIDDRVESRFQEGMLEEVEGLLDRGVSPEWLVSLGLEYKALTSYLICNRLKTINQNSEIEMFIKNCNLKTENLLTFDSLKQALKYAIHHYARRQLIWWRRFEVKWINNTDLAIKEAGKFLRIID